MQRTMLTFIIKGVHGILWQGLVTSQEALGRVVVIVILQSVCCQVSHSIH